MIIIIFTNEAIIKSDLQKIRSLLQCLGSENPTARAPMHSTLHALVEIQKYHYWSQKIIHLCFDLCNHSSTHWLTLIHYLKQLEGTIQCFLIHLLIGNDNKQLNQLNYPFPTGSGCVSASFVGANYISFDYES